MDLYIPHALIPTPLPSPWHDPDPSARPVGQQYLDAGQKHAGPQPCPTCGMVYTRGLPDDEDAHQTFHATFHHHSAPQPSLSSRGASSVIPSAPPVAFRGWKEAERIVATPSTSARVLYVAPSDLPGRTASRLPALLQRLGDAEMNHPEMAQTHFFLYVSRRELWGMLGVVISSSSSSREQRKEKEKENKEDEEQTQDRGKDPAEMGSSMVVTASYYWAAAVASGRGREGPAAKAKAKAKAKGGRGGARELGGGWTEVQEALFGAAARCVVPGYTLRPREWRFASPLTEVGAMFRRQHQAG